MSAPASEQSAKPRLRQSTGLHSRSEVDDQVERLGLAPAYLRAVLAKAAS